MKKIIVLTVFLLVVLSCLLYSKADALYISNKCYKPIRFIIIIKDRDGDWVQCGWYTVNAYREDDDEFCVGVVKRKSFLIYAEFLDGTPFLKGGKKKKFKGSLEKYPFKTVYPKWLKRWYRGKWYKQLTFTFKCK